MHQVKLFKGIESDTGGLEKEINDFLAQSKVRVVNIIGNIAPQPPRPDGGGGGGGGGLGRSFAASDLFVALVYETD